MFTTRRPGGNDREVAAPETQKPVAPEFQTRPAAPIQQPAKPEKTTRGSGGMAPSMIGEDLTIVGNTSSTGEVHVQGKVQGDIHCATLLVGPTAEITGGVVAEDVTVQGKVMGSIRGDRVSLQSSSHVEGDVFHKSLAIEQGAYFEGKSRRSENPVAEAPRLEAKSAASAAASTDGNGNGSSHRTPPAALPLTASLAARSAEAK